MENENVLTDYIKKEMQQEQKNYEHALAAGKSIKELKIIQDRIEYLKGIYAQIADRYQNHEKPPVAG